MKYKKIIEDNSLDSKLNLVNKSELARQVGISYQYLNEVRKGNFAIEENLYLKIKKYLNNVFKDS